MTELTDDYDRVFTEWQECLGLLRQARMYVHRPLQGGIVGKQPEELLAEIDEKLKPETP